MESRTQARCEIGAASGQDAERDRARDAVAAPQELRQFGVEGSRQGEPCRPGSAASNAMPLAPEVLRRVDLGLGDGRGEAFGCDLTEQYVVENSAYST